MRTVLATPVPIQFTPNLTTSRCLQSPFRWTPASTPWHAFFHVVMVAWQIEKSCLFQLATTQIHAQLLGMLCLSFFRESGAVLRVSCCLGGVLAGATLSPRFRSLHLGIVVFGASFCALRSCLEDCFARKGAQGRSVSHKSVQKLPWRFSRKARGRRAQQALQKFCCKVGLVRFGFCSSCFCSFPSLLFFVSFASSFARVVFLFFAFKSLQLQVLHDFFEYRATMAR